MKFTTEDIKKIIEVEITWCLDHPFENLSRDFQSGFVSGLKQAENLLVEMSDRIKNRKKK